MKVNPVQLLRLEQLHTNLTNPKKPMGLRYRKGLKASLERFGFAGLLVVAPDPDGTFEVLDGNTRLDELAAAGILEVPCVVLELDAAGRKAFTLAHDRNRKVFNEDSVLEQLRQLAEGGADVAELGQLAAVEHLEQVLEQAQKAAGTSASVPPAVVASGPRVAPQASLVLYGPSEDVEAIRQLLKRLRGKFNPVIKLRASLEQADAYRDMSDEAFALCFLSALGRTMERE